MTGRVVAVAVGQIVPGNAGAQDIKDAVEDLAVVGAGSTALRGRRQQGFDEFPLFVA